MDQDTPVEKEDSEHYSSGGYMFAQPVTLRARGPHPNRRQVARIAIVFAMSALACKEDEAPTAPANVETQALANTADSEAAAVQGTIPLPINQTFNGGLAFGITQTGTGRAGLFRILNPGSQSDALSVNTNSASRAALRAVTVGGGTAGEFLVNNTTNGQPVINATTEGLGAAGRFVSNNPSNINAALLVFTRGGRGDGVRASLSGFNPGTNPVVGNFIVTTSSKGTAVRGSNSGTGSAGVFEIRNGPNSSPALSVATIGPGWAGDFQGQGLGVRIQTVGGTALSVLGGSKQAVVNTTRGARSLYSEEASEVWFADYGFGRLENGRARILIDPGFAQTVNLETPYHVFLQPYGPALLYVEERTNLGFVVKVKDGDPNTQFGYRLVAKRLGFENSRLERASWADGLAPR
jgi:hypothetical protein